MYLKTPEINLGMDTAAEAKTFKSDTPFPECGTMSQGYIGYHLQNAIGNEMAAEKGYTIVEDTGRGWR